MMKNYHHHRSSSPNHFVGRLLAFASFLNEAYYELLIFYLYGTAIVEQKPLLYNNVNGRRVALIAPQDPAKRLDLCVRPYVGIVQKLPQQVYPTCSQASKELTLIE
mmetsp:Transcript_2333/g.3496  ORF Transcript_2333/g.3496 Transcript_2333/m.3496 type:complete len:106 (+) Transcript_2333:390-707(+)